MADALVGRTIDPEPPEADPGAGGIEMNHEETIIMALHHRDELLADAHRIHTGHRVRQLRRPGPRLWRRRSRPDAAA
jgi:hypothetical protein